MEKPLKLSKVTGKKNWMSYVSSPKKYAKSELPMIYWMKKSLDLSIEKKTKRERIWKDRVKVIKIRLNPR